MIVSWLAYMTCCWWKMFDAQCACLL